MHRMPGERPIHRPRRRPQAGVLAAAVAVAALVVGCAPTGDSGFPVGAAVDYQLGGGYEPAPGVGIVVRDATDEPADDIWSICYVNAFQTQPDGADAFADIALLTDASGAHVIDPAWPDEVVLDTATTASRAAIVDVVGGVIDDCGERGFDAVEFDNLDTFTRFDGLTLDDTIALARTLTERAHDAGLLVGQKNTVEYAQRLRDEVGFDFVIAEECVAFGECTQFTDVYGDAVIDVEYTDDDRVTLATICADPTRPDSTVYRDRDLTTPGDPAHVSERC